MARINRHHIIYIKEHPDGGWVVDLNWLQHKAVTNAQQKHAEEWNYANITNVMHAL